MTQHKLSRAALGMTALLSCVAITALAVAASPREPKHARRPKQQRQDADLVFCVAPDHALHAAQAGASIYFSFNSDAIRDQSQPTLKDIAEVLRRHPEWKLQVNGHTDSIGGDPSNLDLSRRRAAVVKNALVTQQRIGLDRLATAGYGRSEPKDPNDTLEGRAHNRRVELIRIG